MHSNVESRVKKAKGANKRVWNPWPKESPKAEEYCLFLGDAKGCAVPVARGGINLDNCRVARLVGNRATKVLKKGFFVLKKTTMPAFLLENGFMDSTTDVPIILSAEHAEKTAQGILSFLVCEYSLEKKKAVQSDFDDLDECCKLLASKGIIDSPEYWAKGEGYSDSNTVLLIKKFAKYVKGA